MRNKLNCYIYLLCWIEFCNKIKNSQRKTSEPESSNIKRCVGGTDTLDSGHKNDKRYVQVIPNKA